MATYAILNCPIFRAALFHIVECRMGHTVLGAVSWLRVRRLSADSALPLALCGQVRLGDRVRLLEPLAQPWGCAACAVAYGQARDALVAAGGVTEWLAQYEARVSG